MNPTPSQLRAELAAAVKAAGGGAAFARKAGVSGCLVSRTLAGLVEPGERIVNALGYVVQVRIVKLEKTQYA